MKMPKNLGMILLAVWLILFGLLTTSFLNISFAVEDGRLREGLSRLAEFVTEVRPALGAGEERPPALPAPAAPRLPSDQPVA